MTRLAFWIVIAASFQFSTIAGLLQGQDSRFNVHKVAAPIPIPSCSAAGRVVCLTDSTRHYSNECCMSSSSSQWLILPQAGDSLEFFALSPTTHTFLTLYQPGRRSWQESLPGLTAPFLRKRFTEAGVYVLTVDLDPLDSAIGLPYQLRVRSVAKGPLSSVTPLLEFVADSSSWIRVRPTAVGNATSSSATYVVRPGIYRVYAPGIDSLEVCRMPCDKSQVIRLANGSKQTIRP
jgi:hypothetical protein